MTSKAVAEARALKKKTVETLRDLDVASYKLSDIDPRLEDYVAGCIDKPERHNVYELLGVLHFFRKLERYDLRANHVQAYIKYYESLPFSGKAGATQYKMTPVQVFQETNIMGFYLKGSNKRLCREALLFVPRKYGKTTQISAHGLWDLMFGDANAQTFVAANSYDQAQICFREIKEVLKNMDPRLRHFKLNREQIFNLSKNKTSFIRCLASNPDKLDGLNASVVILDEFSQADDADLRNVLTTSMGVRENPLTLYITTASAKRDTPFTNLLKVYKEILRGDREDDRVFAHIYEPDAWDEEGDPETWEKVHPHIGVTIQKDYYENAYREALRSKEDMQTFRNKQLNVFTDDAKSAWISADRIDRLSRSWAPEKCLAVASVDLSVCDDFSAVTYLLYDEARRIDGRPVPFHSVTHFYFPEGQLTRHANGQLYKQWADEGYLRLTKGDVIDYDQIANDLIYNNPYYIRAVGYDSYKSKEFINLIRGAKGAKKILYAIPQTYGAFTSPVECLEAAVYREQMTFEPNPIISFCFGNAVIDTDRMENRKPIKLSKNKKIDGVITNLMCFWLYTNVINNS